MTAAHSARKRRERLVRVMRRITKMTLSSYYRVGPAFTLTRTIFVLMVTQSSLGLVFRDRYRDVAWIKAAWLGNDWITLIVAAPVLIIAMRLARRGSPRATLVWLGLLGYALYNYAYYLFGAAINMFFPLYVSNVILAALALILALPQLDFRDLAAGFRSTTPVRLIGGYLTGVGLALASIWLVMWGAYIFADVPTPIEPEAFRLVAALDMVLMAPALGIGGLLLWRRRPVGYVVATIAGVQSSLYLSVLSVNSAIAIRSGLVTAPGELPLWGALMLLTSSATIALLANIRTHRTARTPIHQAVTIVSAVVGQS